MPCSTARKRKSALIDETYADPVQLQSAAGVASLKRARLSAGSDTSQSQSARASTEPQPVAGPSTTADTGQEVAASTSNSEEPRRIIYINSWKDVSMEDDENEDGKYPVYDDCDEIRRKIRVLQKTPGYKVTHWLKDIGGINSNSPRRFMNMSGYDAGASNQIYYAAYIYFEKNRILTGKEKTETRLENEDNYPKGYPLHRFRGKVYVASEWWDSD